MVMDWCLFVLGIYLVVSSVVRFICPNFALSKALIARLEFRHTRKAFHIWHNINGILLGAALVFCGFLPEQYKLLGLPVLLSILPSILFCNKKCIDSFWAYVPKSKS